MVQRLIPDFEKLDEKSLNDLLIMFAKNIEDALVDAGAMPGEDYSRLDLFKLAQPYVLDRLRSEDDIVYTKSWTVSDD